MCLYHYIYFSACQHAELSKVTYCDTAKLFGLHKQNHHLLRGASAANIPADRQRQSSTHLLASSANNNSSSHLHSQQQPHYNMSTLTPSEAGVPLAWDVAAVERDDPSPHHAAYIPRSALKYDNVHSRENSALHASSLFHNMYTNIPVDTQLSFSVEPTCDGKAMEDIDNFKPSINSSRSDAPEVPHSDLIHEPTKSIHQPSSSNEEIDEGYHDKRVRVQTDRCTIGHSGQEPHSPRKSIPSHWLPKNSGPNLATAQRARVRDSKKGSQSNSPVEARTIHGTRSSVDLFKTHGTEGATFLTKETLAAVEKNITSPALAHSPTKFNHATSKTTLKSPASSPMSGSPRQRGTLLHKTSPARTAFLNTESASFNHKRAPSSIVSSNGGASFHTAEDSPVRSPAESELSFESAVELLDHFYPPVLNVNADGENNQIRGSNGVTASTIKSKPKLSINTAWNAFPITYSQSVTTSASATSSSGASFGQGSSPNSPLQTSRIPRVSTGNKTSSARGPTRSSILKQSKPVNHPSPQMTKSQQDQQVESHRLSQGEAPAIASLRHVRTVDSSGSTPILSRHRTVEQTAHPNMMDCMARVDVEQAQAQSDGVQTHALSEETAFVHAQPDVASADYIHTSNQTSRASSASTIKMATATEDPASLDSSVIYSRKRSDAYDSLRSIDVPDDSASIASSHPTVIIHTSPVRGRSAQYLPSDRKQAESVRSVHSSLASELRATAPEFVPEKSQISKSKDRPGEEATPVELDEAPVMPSFYTLDSYGVPCLYYMYPVPYVFPQGFGKARAKSPRKFRPRKQRSTLSSPVELEILNPRSENNGADVSRASVTSEIGTQLCRVSATSERTRVHVLEPETQRSARRLSSDQSHTRNDVESSSDAECLKEDSLTPFARQIDMITRQAAIRNVGSGNKKHNLALDIDLTTIRNVGVPQGPRDMGLGYNRVSFRRPYRGNGLYGGRGTVGVPMYATAPFPDPVAPMGRSSEYVGYTVGGEACGRVDIDVAAEWGGGPACHGCEGDDQDVE